MEESPYPEDADEYIPGITESIDQVLVNEDQPIKLSELCELLTDVLKAKLNPLGVSGCLVLTTYNPFGQQSASACISWGNVLEVDGALRQVQ